MTWKNQKKMKETKSLLHKERLKEKLGKQDFHYDMEEVFEPVTENQNQNISKQQDNRKANTSTTSFDSNYNTSNTRPN